MPHKLDDAQEVHDDGFVIGFACGAASAFLLILFIGLML